MAIDPRMKKQQNSFHFLVLTALAGLVLISPVRADTIYVSNENNNTIDKIVTFQNSATVTLFANTGLNKPLALALDNSGNLYAANLGNGANGSIEKIDSSGNPSLFASAPGVAFGLAVGANSNVYAGFLSSNVVGQFGTNGQIISSSIWSAKSPWGMAFDASGNLYVADSSDNEILKFTPGGQSSIFATNGLSQPAGLAFDSSGNLYVSNGGNDNIEKFDSNGNGTLFFTSPEPALGLVCDSSNNVYAAFGSVIEKIAPNGQLTGLISSPLFSGAAFFAVQVPEPATWSLLALSAPLLLVLRRQRRRL